MKVLILLFYQVNHTIVFRNGLEAVILVPRELGISEDDEVIIPSNTYTASVFAVSNVETFSHVTDKPAKHLKDVRELIYRFTRKSHYSWPFNHKQGIPWEGLNIQIGYKT